MRMIFATLGCTLLAVSLSGCIIAPPPGPRPIAYRPAPPPPYPPPPRPYYPPPRPYYPPPPPPGVTVGVHIN